MCTVPPSPVSRTSATIAPCVANRSWPASISIAPAVAGIQRTGINSGVVGDFQRVGLNGNAPGVALGEAVAGHTTFTCNGHRARHNFHLAGCAVIRGARVSDFAFGNKVLAQGSDHVDGSVLLTTKLPSSKVT